MKHSSPVAIDYADFIARAADARTLHALNTTVQADECLDSPAKEELSRAVGRRFSSLNHAALKHQKPRW